MKITCLGASGCVTGSCFLLDNGKKYLVDCGLFQGGRQMEALNRQAWGFDPGEISALFLTHAHIDHCGRIPRLVRDGFRGDIYATEPTVELARILLLDAAHIQEMEAEWQNRKNRRVGLPDGPPLYTVKDAESCLSLFLPIPSGEIMTLEPDFKICFRNSGHILGSCFLEIWCGRPPDAHKVVFSGDLGHKGQLIVQEPQSVTEADSVFIESTYGNRNHKSMEESEQELLEAIRYSHKRREKVIIPAFAVERTQEILYLLGHFFRKELIPSMPVYLDSPLAIAATDIFRRMKYCYGTDALDLVSNGQDPFHFPELIYSRSAQDSMAINEKAGPAIVIAGNGMCTAGRIKHHLKHNVWRPGCSLVFVGFQAVGTTGRRIVEGAESVRVFGEKIAIKAKVFTIGGFSAHADQKSLLEWLGVFRNPRLRVYVTHGEQSISETFASLVSERLGFETHIPHMGDVIGLTLPEIVRSPRLEIEVEERPHWQEALELIIRKGEQLRSLYEEAPGALPLHLLERLDEELVRTQGGMDAILQEAMAQRQGMGDIGLED